MPQYRGNALMRMSGRIDDMQNDGMGGFGQSQSPSADRYLSGIGQPLANYQGQRQAMDDPDLGSDNPLKATQEAMNIAQEMGIQKGGRIQDVLKQMWEMHPSDGIGELIEQVAAETGMDTKEIFGGGEPVPRSVSPRQIYQDPYDTPPARNSQMREEMRMHKQHGTGPAGYGNSANFRDDGSSGEYPRRAPSKAGRY